MNRYVKISLAFSLFIFSQVVLAEGYCPRIDQLQFENEHVIANTTEGRWSSMRVGNLSNIISFKEGYAFDLRQNNRNYEVSSSNLSCMYLQEDGFRVTISPQFSRTIILPESQWSQKLHFPKQLDYRCVSGDIQLCPFMFK